jgi:hypothetical protein
MLLNPYSRFPREGLEPYTVFFWRLPAKEDQRTTGSEEADPQVDQHQ